MRARIPTRQTPWPTTQQLEAMGLVRCQGHTDGNPCTTFIDPVNVRSKFCQHHRAEHAHQRRERRFQHRPRTQAAA